MEKVVTVILGGGRGERLYPLTKLRSKPAVPIGGKYRLIDVPISNSIHSGYPEVFILTQFRSASLNRHIARTYRFGPFFPGFVEVLAAEQGENSETWYQGTADAVRKQKLHLFSPAADLYLILSGDHLYRMDYRPFVARHLETSADVSLCAYPVRRDEVAEYGILKMEGDGRIVGFQEKPKDPALLETLRADPRVLEASGVADLSRSFLASMGVYLFRKEALEAVLRESSLLDFGRDVLPWAISRYRVMGYPFSGYWEDIGTIRAFYEAHMRLCQKDPPFHFYEEGWPIFTRPRFLAGSRVHRCLLEDSILADGCHLEDVEVRSSVIGIRSIIRPGTRIARSVLMGADFYESEEPHNGGEIPPLGIGRDCRIEQAIIDKNARIGDRTLIRGAEGREDVDEANYSIRDGIVIVPKNAVLPPGTVI